MNQKTNNTFTFNQVILSRKGNSYLANGSNLISNDKAKNEFALLLQYKEEKRINNLHYFVYEYTSNDITLLATQTSIDKAKFYYNKGNNENRVIVHFDNSFIN